MLSYFQSSARMLSSILLMLSLTFYSSFPALGCNVVEGFKPPSTEELAVKADMVVYGHIEVKEQGVIIIPDKTLKKATSDKIMVTFSGGTCGHVQPNWLKNGDYCLLYLDTNNNAGQY